jgi:hypothetical protein
MNRAPSRQTAAREPHRTGTSTGRRQSAAGAGVAGRPTAAGSEVATGYFRLEGYTKDVYVVHRPGCRLLIYSQRVYQGICAAVKAEEFVSNDVHHNTLASDESQQLKGPETEQTSTRSKKLYAHSEPSSKLKRGLISHTALQIYLLYRK